MSPISYSRSHKQNGVEPEFKPAKSGSLFQVALCLQEASWMRDRAEDKEGMTAVIEAVARKLATDVLSPALYF